MVSHGKNLTSFLLPKREINLKKKNCTDTCRKERKKKKRDFAFDLQISILMMQFSMILIPTIKPETTTKRRRQFKELWSLVVNKNFIFSDSKDLRGKKSDKIFFYKYFIPIIKFFLLFSG